MHFYYFCARKKHWTRQFYVRALKSTKEFAQRRSPLYIFLVHLKKDQRGDLNQFGLFVFMLNILQYGFHLPYNFSLGETLNSLSQIDRKVSLSCPFSQDRINILSHSLIKTCYMPQYTGEVTIPYCRGFQKSWYWHDFNNYTSLLYTLKNHTSFDKYILVWAEYCRFIAHAFFIET